MSRARILFPIACVCTLSCILTGCGGAPDGAAQPAHESAAGLAPASDDPLSDGTLTAGSAFPQQPAGAHGPGGACCLGSTCVSSAAYVPCCEYTSHEACAAQGGAFLGEATTCMPEACTIFLTLDSDNDGATDAEELAQGNDPDNPLDGPDIDGDGIPNGADPDVDGDGVLNVVDVDINGNGILNAFDPDDDADGFPDAIDPDDNANGIPDFNGGAGEHGCNDNGDCDRGEICYVNLCGKPPGCESAGDCDDDELCDAPRNRCLPKECEEDGNCPNGDKCTFNRCFEQSCGKDEDCEFNEVCRDNRCYDKCTRDAGCRFDEICVDMDHCEEPCTADSCDDMKACTMDECQQGVCRHVEICEAGQSCFGGECAECGSAEDCPAGESCYGGDCKECELDSHCPGDPANCMDGVCDVDTCRNEPTCENRVCENGACRDCVGSEDCPGDDGNCEQGVCAEGECSTESICSSGENCVNGECGCSGSDEPCPDDLDDCKEGFCEEAMNRCATRTTCADNEQCFAGSCKECETDADCTDAGDCEIATCSSNTCAYESECVAGTEYCEGDTCVDCNCEDDAECDEDGDCIDE